MTALSTFEIRVALLGCGSVGKTTVLNALLRDKYSQVAMHRTAAAVNCIRIIPAHKGDREKGPQSSGTLHSRMAVPGDPTTAASLLNESTADNSALRKSDIVQEETFDIELDEPVCEMRKDTILVMVHIPAINNEAGAGTKYKDYMVNNWHTFDCAIVVMDGGTEEQLALLKLVHDQNHSNKRIDVIVLYNKVDDPDDKEQKVVLQESRTAVELIFGVQERNKVIQSLHRGPVEGTEFVVSPAFIAISALQAHFYQSCGAGMDFNQFLALDTALIDNIGRDFFGKKWTRMSVEEKYKEAYALVSDSEQCREGFEQCNFGTFLSDLKHFVGGETTQNLLLKRQQEVATSRNPTFVTADGLTAELELIWERSKALNIAVDPDKLPFWKCYGEIEKKSLTSFRISPAHLDALDHAMTQLMSYHEFVGRFEWRDEEILVVEAMKKLVRQQIAEVLYQESKWDIEAWRNDKVATTDPAGDAKSWADLSPKDWPLLLGSILLVGADRHFYENFGREQMELDTCLQRARTLLQNYLSGQLNLCDSCFRGQVPGHRHVMCTRCGTHHRSDGPTLYMFQNPMHYPTMRDQLSFTCPCGPLKSLALRRFCPFCGIKPSFCDCCNEGKFHNCIKRGGIECSKAVTFDSTKWKEVFLLQYKEGRMEPSTLGNNFVSIAVPDSPSDKRHFGHLVWRFCRFMESRGICECGNSAVF